MTLNVLSLFSGIGGLDLGLECAGMSTVGQVEIDPFCQSVLAKHWPNVPRHEDVRTATGWWLQEERPSVDLICGGFPCQDISNAGARAGIINGAKSSLWKSMVHVIRELEPRYVLVENVAALVVRGLDVVLADLHELGFNAQWSVLSACAMGAPHTRERLFLLAYSNDPGQQAGGKERVRDDHSMDGRRERHPEHLHETAELSSSPSGAHWQIEPELDRMADGFSPGLDRRRLFALGNAVVPQVGEAVGRVITQMEIERTAAL